MARIVLKGGPSPGPMTLPTDLPPPHIDTHTANGVFRYLRTEETDARDRVIYTTGELVMQWGDPPP